VELYQKASVLPGSTNGSTTSAWSAPSVESALVTGPVVFRPEDQTETRAPFAAAGPEILVARIADVAEPALERREIWYALFFISADSFLSCVSWGGFHKSWAYGVKRTQIWEKMQ
jgi:hypothetical protein